jgi:alpha-L-rhamnosidase
MMSLKLISSKCMYILIVSFFICSGLIFCGGPIALAADFSLDDLEVEHMVQPLGLDVKEPQFSWKLKVDKEKRGISQVAYQVIVKDILGEVIWDTGKVTSSDAIGLKYDGIALEPESRYNWTVKVWDKQGEMQKKSSWFETGLNMQRSGSGNWDNASWIGGENKDLPLYSQSLSVFRVKYALKISQGSTKASFILGANDSRLMDKNKNLYNLQSGQDQSFIKLELDTAKVSAGGEACINIYRQGYSKDDSLNPLTSITIPTMLVNTENQNAKHTIEISSNFGIFNFWIDGTQIELPRVNFWTTGSNVNPVGAGGDYIAFPMVADIGFSVDKGEQADFSDVQILNYRAPQNAVFAERLGTEPYTGIFSHKAASGLAVKDGVYHLSGGTDGAFITADPSHGSMPLLRSNFVVKNKKIASARLYATARGIYEFYINGKRVGNDYFAPGLTQYNITQLYQTYDVTNLLQEGKKNAMGAQLSEGWWSGAITFQGENWNYFGDRQSLLAKMVITYTDGTKEVFTTNPEKWKFYGQSPIVLGSFFQGEAYDARKEAALKSWATASYSDLEWQSASVVPADAHTAFIGQWAHCMTGTVTDHNYENFTLVGQTGTSVKGVLTLTAQAVREVRPGVFVYDMGQNMAGVPKITIKNGKAGTKIVLRYAEMTYPDHEKSGENRGMIMIENIRGALAQDTYILKGGEEVIVPHFTYHGYRYIEITGIDKALLLEVVQGVVLSSIPKITADYKSSNPDINRLWQNIVWSSRANFLSIPTDCPQRNERMGWSGDLSVFSRTASYVTDADQFLARHLQALRDLQDKNGRFGDIAPIGNGFGGFLWGSVGITVPWELYQQYGDKAILTDHYNAMKQYILYLDTKVNSKGLLDEATIMGLGDWLGPEYSKNEPVFLWSAYHVYDLWIMGNTADILGHSDDAAMYWQKYTERKNFFNKTFVNVATHKTMKTDGTLMDTQTSYAVPLALGVFSEENIPYAAKYLADACTRKNTDDNKIEHKPYALMTGFIGTAWISKALSDNGYTDIAYKMLENTDYPSWLYPVKQGATTIWERLDSYTKERGFGGNNSMNSFNHYSFGAVGAWLYNYSLGIQRDPASPGFKHFILQPHPDFNGSLKNASGYYDSSYGKIESAWKIADSKWSYNATVPANTTATLCLPIDKNATVLESGKPLIESKEIVFVAYENGRAIYRLESGTYQFEIKE